MKAELDILIEEAPPNCCPLCDEPLKRRSKTGRKPKYCWNKECRRALPALYVARWRKNVATRDEVGRG